MVLTRKQQSVIRLRRAGLGPTEISRSTGQTRETVSRLLSRAKRNLRRAGLDPEKMLADDQRDILELIA